MRREIGLAILSLSALTAISDGGLCADMMDALPITNISLFVWPLLIPSNALPAGMVGTNLMYEMRMRTNSHQFHPDLPAVPIWGYSDSTNLLGSSPGPTMQATNGVPIYVRWVNELPSQYPSWIPADIQNHGVTNQDVYNIVHLHGGATRPEFDGYPTARFRPNGATNYYYDNIDLSPVADGETLWYHDHALGLTANNVYAGLAGFYLLRNPDLERALRLPAGPYEVPLAFQDRDIQTNVPPATLLSDLASMNAAPWHYLPVVNGRVAPYFEVEPRRYRFRVLNACSSRTIGLALVTTNTSAGQTNVPIYQIGTDDGFLAAPVSIPTDVPILRLMPAERADVIIDFTRWTNAFIVVTNAFGPNDPDVPPFAPVSVVGNAFLQFRVLKPLSGPDTSSLPAVIFTNVATAQDLAFHAVKTRRVTLDVSIELPNPGMDFAADPHLFALLNMMHFDGPVTELPRAGDVEIWEFANLSGIPHPMHIHLIDFLVLDRRSFQGWNGNPSFVPQGVADYIVDRQLGRLQDLEHYLDMSANGVLQVDPNERGPKDVVNVPPGAVTRVVMRWPTNEIFFGPYVYHCHILDHEDNDMMRPLQLLPPLTNSTPLVTFDLAEGAISLQVGTHLGLTRDVLYDVQASSDLQTWRSLAISPGTGMTLYLKDPDAYALDPAGNPTGGPYRFYRALVYP